MFLLLMLNILGETIEDTYLKANQLNMRTDNIEFESPWTNILLKGTEIKEKLHFDEDLMKDNSCKLNVKSLTDGEKFMFNILNYCLEDDRSVFENLNQQYISNVIINIFNPVRYDWAENYVKYVISKRKTIQNIQALNNNIIKLIADNFLFEWPLSKAICKSPFTILILEKIFQEKSIASKDPKNYISLIFWYLEEKNIRLNLFVVYLEILKHLKNLPKENLYYYELCGLSTYLFSSLSMFTNFRAYRVSKLSLPKNAVFLMANINESMIILYYVVRLVLNRQEKKGIYISSKINGLIFQCLYKVGRCSVETSKKAFGCINMIRLKKEKCESTELLENFYIYIRTYILPITIISEKYINDLHKMLVTVKDILKVDKHDLFYDMRDFYELTMFLSTE